MSSLFQSAAYLSSWRGQLVICLVAIIIGLIIFAAQGFWVQWNLQNKERTSKQHLAELISMEDEKKDKEVEDVKAVRGREKKREKDARKRKGSLLKVPVPPVSVSGESSTAISSIESSPAPAPRSTFSTPKPHPRSASAKGKGVAHPASEQSQQATPTKTTPKPQPKELKSTPIIDESRPTPRPLAPWEIPLPASPIAGPSRLPLPAREADLDSLDGDLASASESAASNAAPTGTSAPLNPTSSGFSIIPEEGYLPPSVSAPSTNKKKKRKGRAPPPSPLPIERRTSKSGIEDVAATPARSRVPDSPSIPVTPSQRARKASLIRPVNADLEELLTERERMIESLRAEVGLSKAEEAKAREEASRARATEDRLTGDFERVKSAKQRSENEARKREGELNTRLAHLSTLYTAALHRIGSLEAVFQNGGNAFPPSSPAISFPHQQQQQQMATPVSIQHHQSMLSPMPSSPYGVGYGPSPRAVSAGFVPYPSPGLFPSPMLHPHAHQHSHSPSPFRRASTTGMPDDGLAGPLTPGNLGTQSFPFEMGVMPSPRPPTQLDPSAPPSVDDLRRISIEGALLRKKVQDGAKSGSESGESNRNLEAVPDIDETITLEGLGMGEIGGAMQRDESNGECGSGSSHPSSPSPPNRASVLLTPASAEVFHRALVRGTDTPEDFSRRDSIQDGLNGIKVIPDVDRGNLYYTSSQSLAGSEGEGGSDNASAYEPREEKTNGHQNGQSNGEGEKTQIDEEFVPVFASLAHTPQQLAEIQRMTNQAMKARMTRNNGQS